MVTVLGSKHDGAPVQREEVTDAVLVFVDCEVSCMACVGRGKSKMLMPLEQGKRYHLELEGNALAAIKDNVKIVDPAVKVNPVEPKAEVKPEPVVAEPVVEQKQEEVKEPAVEKVAEPVKKSAKKK